MASNTHQKISTRKLGQLLQEKQEPFKMQIYLLERGYSKTGANLKNLEFLKSGGLNKRKKMGSRFSKIVRKVVNKLKNSETKSDKEINGEERFSASNNITVFDYCSGSDTDESEKQEVDAEGEEYKQRCMENKQQQQEEQFSPVSVLEETHSDQNSPLHNVEQETSKVTKNVNTKFSVTLSKLLENSSAEKQMIRTEIPSDYTKIKLQLQHTQQLLFDCVKEVVQSYKFNNRRQQETQFLGAEEIGSLLHEKVLEWSKQSKTDGNINFDLSDSFEEWKYDSQEQRIGIARVIGDSIVDDIINEIVKP